MLSAFRDLSGSGRVREAASHSVERPKSREKASPHDRRARQVARWTSRKQVERGLEPPVYGSRQPRSTLLGPLSRYLRERVAAFSELSAGRDRRWLPL